MHWPSLFWHSFNQWVLHNVSTTKANSLCRACVLYSDKSAHGTTEMTDDLSKCHIKEVEKQHADRNGGIPMTRLPLQVPQNVQGKTHHVHKPVCSIQIFALDDVIYPS